MKRKIILRLSYLIVFLTVFWSCHNEDFANGNIEPQRNNANFFLHSTKGGAAAKSGADYVAILEAYNRDKNFLSTMPDQQGMPIWDKMQVVDTDHATGLMIPLSYDNETMSSVLFATLDADNMVTGVTDFDNKLLESIVNDQRISKLNRERLFYTFMYMDNKTFGNEYFIGIPKDLFIGDKSDGDRSTVWMRDFSPATATAGETGKIIIIESCVLVLHCTHHGTGACDAANGCTKCGHTECSYQIIITGDDDPFPSVPSGGCSECGGGGTPGPQPPVDPCAMNTVFYRLAPGCLGSGESTGIDDPCKKIKNKFSETKFKEKVAAIDKAEVFNYDHEMGFAAGYPPANTGVIGTQYPPMENVIGSHSVRLPDGNQYFGFLHSHNNKEGAVKIFSPYDLATFLTSCVANANSGGSMGDAYAMVITSEGNYILQYTGVSSSFGTGPNTIKFWNLWYERELKAIQNDDSSFDQDQLEKVFLRFLKEKVQIDGVQLYKVEKLTGKAKELTLDINNNVVPLECK